MSGHHWAAIGHLGDGNEYVVWTCRNCGLRATTNDFGRNMWPDNTNYPPCKTTPKTAPEPPKTVWDRLMGKDP